MESIINGLKKIWLGSTEKNEVSGHLLMEDKINNKSLILIKMSENGWQSRWYNNDEINIKSSELSINSIFIGK